MTEDSPPGGNGAARVEAAFRLESLDTAPTVRLVPRVLGGDQHAAEVLFARYLPVLRRWARGRLPLRTRDSDDTQDLVQDALHHAIGHLEGFEWHGEASLQAYLRQAILNRIRDHLRHLSRQPIDEDLQRNTTDDVLTPLEQSIGRERLERYERALQRVRPEDRDAIIGRIELQQTYEELAAVLEKPSADAARVATVRAVRRLIEEMQRHE